MTPGALSTPDETSTAGAPVIASARQAGLMLRHTVQFHWHNRHPQQHKPFSDFDDFLMSLSQGKRKKIRVFKKKRRKGYMRTQGHRQLFTEITIREIKA